MNWHQHYCHDLDERWKMKRIMTQQHELIINFADTNRYKLIWLLSLLENSFYVCELFALVLALFVAVIVAVVVFMFCSRDTEVTAWGSSSDGEILYRAFPHEFQMRYSPETKRLDTVSWLLAVFGEIANCFLSIFRPDRVQSFTLKLMLIYALVPTQKGSSNCVGELSFEDFSKQIVAGSATSKLRLVNLFPIFHRSAFSLLGFTVTVPAVGSASSEMIFPLQSNHSHWPWVT